MLSLRGFEGNANILHSDNLYLWKEMFLGKGIKYRQERRNGQKLEKIFILKNTWIL